MTASATDVSARRAQASLALSPLTSLGSASICASPSGHVSGQLGAAKIVSGSRLWGRASLAARLGQMTSSAIGRLRTVGSLGVVLGALTLVAAGRRLVPTATPPERVARVATESRVVKAR